MRTTIDIDTPILKEVKALQKKEGQSLGRLISDLLAQALRARKTGVGKSATPPGWVSKPMGARVDLGDKEALYAAMERPPAVDGTIRP
ncbi:MAG: antitoxin [Gammaproteobacteria bacterium]